MKRFWGKVKKSNCGCWYWQAATRAGYGAFKLDGSVVSAHRFAYEYCVGPIPDGLLVCHTCDNKLCVNPDHLFTGTHSDNYEDAVSKGIMDPLTPPQRNLTNEDAAQAKELIRTGVTMSLIAERLSVGYHVIKDIKSGKCYVNI